MSDMRCARCGNYGIHWCDLTTSPWTLCPHCGGRNCQEPPEDEVTLDDLDDADFENWREDRS